MAYRLKQDGQIVYTFARTIQIRGKDSTLTKAVVGRKGQEFDDLAPRVVEQIDAGQLDDVWEVVGDSSESFVEADAGGVGETGDKSDGDDSDPHGHDADAGHVHEEISDKLSNERLEQLVEMHALTVEGTGAQGKIVKGDMVTALLAEHGLDTSSSST